MPHSVKYRAVAAAQFSASLFMSDTKCVVHISNLYFPLYKVSNWDTNRITSIK